MTKTTTPICGTELIEAYNQSHCRFSWTAFLSRYLFKLPVCETCDVLCPPAGDVTSATGQQSSDRGVDGCEQDFVTVPRVAQRHGDSHHGQRPSGSIYAETWTPLHGGPGGVGAGVQHSGNEASTFLRLPMESET